jgi:hypothetical protein
MNTEGSVSAVARFSSQFGTTQVLRVDLVEEDFRRETAHLVDPVQMLEHRIGGLHTSGINTSRMRFFQPVEVEPPLSFFRLALSSRLTPSERKVIVTDGRRPDGILVDVHAGHIYWTNTGVPNEQVVMSRRPDSIRTVLLPRGSSKPERLAR